jgi:hypothetical protein
MEGGSRKPSWMVPAVVGLFIALFMAVAIFGGSLSK